MAGLTALTQQDLLDLQCQMPGCTHERHDGEEMYLHPRCHMGGGTDVSYKKGVLTIVCHVCKKHIADIAVHH